jgi:hypothetical protein
LRGQLANGPDDTVLVSCSTDTPPWVERGFGLARRVIAHGPSILAGRPNDRPDRRLAEYVVSRDD